MLELQQIEQLVAVADCGTLSAAAEELHVSQSVLSRSMQRLEAELGVTLFDRSRNRIVFNEVGRRAVDYARVLLQAAQNFSEDVQAYAEKISTFRIGCSAPAPLRRLSQELHEVFPTLPVAEELRSAAQLAEGLRQGHYRLILSDVPVEEPGLLCRRYVEDGLMLELPAGHPLSRRETLSIDDLRGLTVLIYRSTGMWRERMSSIEGLHIIEQPELDVLNDLLLSASLPNLSSTLFPTPTVGKRGRVSVPIVSELTVQTFYLAARESDRALFQRFCG